jgi:FAD/FMN-containing dehydrogenase
LRRKTFLRSRNYIGYSKSEAAIQLMQQIKNVFDPQGIMNPYKVLPDKSS